MSHPISQVYERPPSYELYLPAHRHLEELQQQKQQRPGGGDDSGDEQKAERHVALGWEGRRAKGTFSRVNGRNHHPQRD